jgi:predicted choloylglycine hydrolase
MLLSLNSIEENNPGSKWKAVFDKTWPFYKHWFLSEGHTTRPGYLTSINALRKHMPELMPFYEQLCELAGGSDIASRYLSMYCPPAYMRGCTQLAWTQNGASALIRNYDYNPRLFEGVMLNSNWLQPVMGVSDCNWGLLDGMNASGLAISLTFGGRKILGKGFGIPLLLRYILETCTNVKEAKAVFNRIPVHMTYNVTLVDKSGDFSTIYLAPDRKPIFLQTAVATNHQETIEWHEYASFSKTMDRKTFLEYELLNQNITRPQIERKFFEAPLYQNNLDRAFLTLYTAVYDPEAGRAKIMWPSKTLFQSFEHFEEKRTVINLGKPLVDTLA